MEIYNSKNYKFGHVLSVRKKFLEPEIGAEIMRMGEYIRAHHIAAEQTVISVAYGVDQTDGKQWIDMEVLIPITITEALSPEVYEVKRDFAIMNAVAILHLSGTQNVHESVQALIDYTKSHSLTPTSPMYNITYAPSSPMNDPIIELCMSVA